MIEGEQYWTMEYEFTKETNNGGGSMSMSIMDNNVGSKQF